MANWMELPNYPMATFRQQRQACRGHNDQIESLRATYEEVRAYYIHYVKRNRLLNYFRNGYEIISIERVSIDAPFYDDLTKEIRTPEALWEIRGYDEQNKNPFILHAKYVVLATGISQDITKSLGIIGEQTSQSFTYTNLHDIEDLIINKKRLRNNSKPLLVIGCGLTAIDVILLCQKYLIPILHVFRRAIDDHELVLNQLPATIYPEYERIKELIRQSSTEWSYQCCPQSEIVSITENGTVHIRNLRTQITTDYEISFIARLTGAEIKIPFFPLVSMKKNNGLNINPYTYECIDFENVYALGALAGDKLVRFLQGGAFACAANLFKKHRQMLFNVNSRTRIAL
jgi:thioredoxin reductase